MVPKRLATWPMVFLLTAALGAIMILIALCTGPSPAPPISASTQDTGQAGLAQTAEPAELPSEPASGPETRSVEPSSPLPKSATPPPPPSPTSAPVATPTPSPTPVPLSSPLLGSTGAVAYVEGKILYVIHSDQADATIVSDGATNHAKTMGWSPDGRWLLFSVGSGTGQPAVSLWDQQTAEVVRLRDIPGFPVEQGSIREISWSPGGTRVLLRFIASSTGSWVLEPENRKMWALPDLPARTGSWLADDLILYEGEGSGSLRLLRPDSPGEVLTETLTVEAPYAISPSAKSVAFFEKQSDGREALSVVPVRGVEPPTLLDQPIITAEGRNPLWSPDSRWVAYGAKEIAPDRTGGPYTLVADTTGVYQTQVFQGLLPSAWSPDGRLLAGFGCFDGACRLSLISIAAGRVTDVVTGGHIQLWDVAWSPQATYLAYSLAGSGLDEEGLILWDRGTGERRVLLEGTGTESATDIQWTPDGCSIYAALRDVGTGPNGPVSAIWLFGPAWENRLQVAPLLSEKASSLNELLARRDREREGYLCPGPLLEDRRLVAFYGTPLGPGLGILGRHGISETLTLLEQQYHPYQALDPDINTLPALHMVTTIADDFPGADGDYNHRVAHDTIRPWIDAIRLRGGLSILDVQPGRGDLATELDAIEPLLREPDVHLAVDPEFIVRESQVPGQDLGQITGPQVNYLQSRVEDVARQTGHRKILVIHQFDDRMIENKDAVLDYPMVDLVWDADGFGGPGSKIADYNQYRLETGFEYGGFKIFYRYDVPVMTPEQVLALDPRPRLVIYQ